MREGQGRVAPGRVLPAFAELAPHLDSGDVLLFSGSSRFSRGIKRFLRSNWSHAALVARGPAGQLLLWEATLSPDIPDVATREVRPGVNLYDLAGWVHRYGEETAIRRLHAERTPAMRESLLEFYREARGRPYEVNRLELLRAAYDGPLGRNREPDLSSFFCSELVAEALQRMGVLAAGPASCEYTPRDFSSERTRPLPLLGGARLGPEVTVCSAAQVEEG